MTASFCRKVFRKIYRIFSVTYAKAKINLSWLVCSKLRGWRGVTDEDYGRQLIISLTSFPPRINTVHKTIQSLMLQTMKANKITLWLAEDEFPDRDNELPDELLNLKSYGLEIHYCKNLRSFKKLIPALKLFPDANIITADDDLYYRDSWLKALYDEHVRHPEDLCVHRITKFYIDENGEFRIIGGGYDTYSCGASYLHKLSGGAGAFYCPNIFHADVMKEELFMTLCPTSDDIWFWLMAVLNHVKIRAAENNYAHLALAYVGKTQKGPRLCDINDKGEKLFWKHFYNILNHYPQLEEILREEYKRLSKAGA